jgi:hypothetical protein
MSCGSHALNFIDKGGHGVDGAVMWSGPELGHQEEVKAFNVSVDTFGDNLL